MKPYRNKQGRFARDPFTTDQATFQRRLTIVFFAATHIWVFVIGIALGAWLVL